MSATSATPNHFRQHTQWVAAIVALLLLLAACGGGTPEPTPTPRAASDDPSAGSAPNQLCAQGRLRLGDLAAIDATAAGALAAARDEALAWQGDARLVAVQVACRMLESAVRWQATFFSPAARSVLLTGTGETRPVDDDPAQVRDLPTDDLSFASLLRALTGAGYDDALLLSANGVTVQLSTDEHPFGPPTAPRDAVYYHVAVDVRGEIDDVFVAADGTVHRYDA